MPLIFFFYLKIHKTHVYTRLLIFKLIIGFLLPSRGHLEDVYDICWTSDGNYMASASVDNTAIMWDVNKGKCCTYPLEFQICWKCHMAFPEKKKRETSFFVIFFNVIFWACEAVLYIAIKYSQANKIYT